MTGPGRAGRARRAFTAIEVTLASLLLAVSFTTVVAVSTGTLNELAHCEESILAESLLHDMVEYLSQQPAAFFRASGFPASDEAAGATAADPVAGNRLLGRESFDARLRRDPASRVQERFDELMRSFEVRRKVLYVDRATASGARLATAVVEWRSQSGRRRSTRRSFAVYGE